MNILGQEGRTLRGSKSGGCEDFRTRHYRP